MSDLIEEIAYRGRTIKVYYDTMNEGPDEWKNEDVFLVYDHRQFNIKRDGYDPQTIFEECFKVNEQRQLAQIKNLYDGYWVLPLYAYIHSGVSLSLGKSSYPFTCQWDTSFTGFVLVKKQKGWTWRREKAYEVAQSLVTEWNQYLSGDVYGYDSEEGGCWGFYGDEGKKYMIEEAKLAIDAAINDKFKRKIAGHLNQLRAWVTNKVPIQYRQPSVLLENV